MNSKIYTMRKNALEGTVFYYNKLADVEYQKIYFPPTSNQPNYWNAPKIAVPITSTFVNRLASTLHNGMQVVFTNPQLQNIWDSLANDLEWGEVSRSLLIDSLIGGNVLATILENENKMPVLELWKGEYIFSLGEDNYGYEYILKDGSSLMIPVISEPKLKPNEKLIRTLINDVQFGNTIHNLGFTPAVMFKSVDKDEDGMYGVPYYMRYRDLNIEYNHVMSQISKSIKIMQNVWVVKTSIISEDTPLRLDPDTINYVGQDGDLSQAVRNLNIDPEHTYASELLRLIHNAAQIPDFMSGLSGVGKVESGVALQIVSTPIIELTTRIRQSYKEDITELVGKLMSCLYLFNGTTPPELEFDVKLNENIIPIDKQQEIDNVIKLVGAGIITAEQAQQITLPLFGLE